MRINVICVVYEVVEVDCFVDGNQEVDAITVVVERDATRQSSVNADRGCWIAGGGDGKHITNTDVESCTVRTGDCRCFLHCQGEGLCGIWCDPVGGSKGEFVNATCPCGIFTPKVAPVGTV